MPAIIGYARVSTGDQNPDLQRDALTRGRLHSHLKGSEPRPRRRPGARPQVIASMSLATIRRRRTTRHVRTAFFASPDSVLRLRPRPGVVMACW
jgi:hypothetical protein